MFHRRSKREDAFLPLKTGIFLLGAALALVGMFFESTAVIYSAMGVLLVALALRWFRRGE